MFTKLNFATQQRPTASHFSRHIKFFSRKRTFNKFRGHRSGFIKRRRFVPTLIRQVMRSNNRYLNRNQVWKRCKKPFWKRKSFKRFRILQNYLQQFFFFTSKTNTACNLHRRLGVRSKLPMYFRSNSIRKWFKTSIYLRFYWQNRYSFFSHTKLKNYLLKFKFKINRLLVFIRTAEFVLARYVSWWSLVPSYLHLSFFQSDFFITHGFILVNFTPQYNPNYIVRDTDCIFFFSPMGSGYGNYNRQRFFFWNSKIFVSSFRNFGTTKNKVGHPAFRRNRFHFLGLRYQRNLKFFFYSFARACKLNKLKQFYVSSTLDFQTTVRLKSDFISIFSSRYINRLLNLSWFFLSHRVFYTFYGGPPFFELSYKFRIVTNLYAIYWVIITFFKKGGFDSDCNMFLFNRALNYSYW